MLPSNIAQLILEEDPDKASAVRRALSNPHDTEGNLSVLGSLWPIKVTFKDPVCIYVSSMRTKTTTQHTFNFMCTSKLSNVVYYYTRKNSRRGYRLNEIPLIVRYEVVNPTDEFSSYEAFAHKFDLRFISEAEVAKLWSGTSPQHGGKFKPSDFRYFGPKGLKVVNRFIKDFAGINAPEPGNHWYRIGFMEKGYELHVSDKSLTSSGRDIRISHQIGKSMVFYSSLLHGTGNGLCGILATEKTYLFIEYD
jgi:hypothetical protein